MTDITREAEIMQKKEGKQKRKNRSWAIDLKKKIKNWKKRCMTNQWILKKNEKEKEKKNQKMKDDTNTFFCYYWLWILGLLHVLLPCLLYLIVGIVLL